MIKRISLFLFLIVLFPLTAQSSDPRELYLQGMARFDQEDYYGAIESFREALELNPHYLEALIEISRSYFMIEEYQEAQNFIEEAQIYGRNDLEILNMQGRILIGRNELDQALELFRQVIRREPNNLEANLGRAEVLLLKGQHQEGAVAFRRSLILSPESKRALISMMLLFDSRMEYDKGEIYLDLALKYHSDDPQVYLQAAHHYLKTGNLEKALFYGENAVQINPDLPGPDYILAMIYTEQLNYDAALSALERELRRNSRDQQALYLMARCLVEKGDPEQALLLLRRMLRMDSYDEISRLLLEELVRELGSSAEEERDEALTFHYQRGQRLEEEYNLSGAKEEYRRARWLNRYHYPSWLAYGELLKKQGFPSASLDTMRAISAAGYQDPLFQENLKILEHSREKTLADRWGVEQFTQENNPYGISLFYRKNSSMYHYSSEESLARFMDYHLQGKTNLDVLSSPRQVNSFSQAYSRARSEGSDYFLVLEFSEQERSFLISATLYLTRTGREIHRFSLLRLGNNRVSSAVSELSREVSSFFLPRGILLDLEGDRGLINLGLLQGVEEGDTFQVFKKDSLSFLSEAPWIHYDSEDFLGTLEVDALDENLAAGIWTNNGPFILVAPGDEIFQAAPDENPEDGETPSWTIDQDLKRQLLMFR